MGNYATTTSISQILPGYLKSNTTTSDPDGTAIFSRFIDDAEAEINSALANRYSLPFSPVPPLLRSLSGHIAAYYAIRGGFSTEGRSKNEYLSEYNHSMKVIQDLLEGKRKLTYTDGSLVPVNTSNRFMSSTENYTPIFGRDDPRKWERDQDEIDDTSDSRA